MQQIKNLSIAAMLLGISLIPYAPLPKLSLS
jgi:hypothetical protein